MTLEQAIVNNRKREERFNKAERMLRRLRQRVFDYQDAGRGEQADYLMLKCKKRLAPRWKAQAEARQAIRDVHSEMVAHGAD